MQSVQQLREFFDKNYDSRGCVELYYSPQSDFVTDSIAKPLQEISNLFTSGMVKGDTLLDFSFAPTIHEALPACITVKEITMLNLTKGGAEDLEKWWRNEPGAIDWGTYVKHACTGEPSGEHWEEKQDKLRSVITKILSCDMIGGNPFTPLENSSFDCIIGTFVSGCLCNDKASFISLLRNMHSLLRPGGHLIFLESLCCSFFTDNKLRFPYLHMDEKFIREALKEAGFITEKQVLYPRHDLQETGLADHDAFCLSVARKP